MNTYSSFSLLLSYQIHSSTELWLSTGIMFVSAILLLSLLSELFWWWHNITWLVALFAARWHLMRNWFCWKKFLFFYFCFLNFSFCLICLIGQSWWNCSRWINFYLTPLKRRDISNLWRGLIYSRSLRKLYDGWCIFIWECGDFWQLNFKVGICHSVNGYLLVIIVKIITDPRLLSRVSENLKVSKCVQHFWLLF